MELNYRLVPLILIGLSFLLFILQGCQLLITDYQASSGPIIALKHIYHASIIIS